MHPQEPRRQQDLDLTSVWQDLDILPRFNSMATPADSRHAVDIHVASISCGPSPWRLIARKRQEAGGRAKEHASFNLKAGDEAPSADFVCALLNSPVANAYVHCHLKKGDNLPCTLLNLPTPRLRVCDTGKVAQAVANYRKMKTMEIGSSAGRLKNAYLRIDAEILRCYNLYPRMEKEILDLFYGYQRPGVPFVLTKYFPADFEPCIPLHEYLSPEYKLSTAGELRKRLQTFDDPEISQALRIACEAFTLDPEVND